MRSLFSIPTILAYLAILLAVHILSSQSAKASTVVCETPFGQKKMIITDKNISLVKQDFSGKLNKISFNGSKVQTEKTDTGFIKVISYEGYLHKIYIRNIKDLNEVEDYLSITSRQGHKITYPLTCKPS